MTKVTEFDFELERPYAVENNGELEIKNLILKEPTPANEPTVWNIRHCVRKSQMENLKNISDVSGEDSDDDSESKDPLTLGSGIFQFIESSSARIMFLKEFKDLMTKNKLCLINGEAHMKGTWYDNMYIEDKVRLMRLYLGHFFSQ